MIGPEWSNAQFVYNDKRRRIYVPTIVLAEASRDFQIGYIYSALVQKIRPKIQECPGCGKMHAPVYTFEEGAIRKVDHSAAGGGGGGR